MTTAPEPAVIVVPCFNEARRIDERAFLGLAATGQVRLLFVDDGSTDDTGRILTRMAETSQGIEVFSLASKHREGRGGTPRSSRRRCAAVRRSSATTTPTWPRRPTSSCG